MSFDNKNQMYEGYIYCITNQITQKQYIGQTSTTVDFRWKQHLYRSTQHKYAQYLYNSMNKYGENNFSVVEVDKVFAKDNKELHVLLDKCEIKYIKEYNTKYPNGYNMTTGADFNPTYYTAIQVCKLDNDYNLLKTFKSIEEAHVITGFPSKAISNSCKTHYILRKYNCLFCYFSELDDVINYKPFSFNDTDYKNYHKSICQYSLDGKFIKKFSGAKELIGSLGKSSCGSIYMALKKKINHSMGYLWSWEGESPQEYIPQYTTLMKKVNQYDLDFNYIQTFDSLSDTAQIQSINNAQAVRSACIGVTFQSGGYMWRYEGENSDNPLLFYGKNGYMLPVIQFDSNHRYIKNFSSIYEASKETSISISRISLCCNPNSRFSKAGKCYWEYADEAV